MDRPDVESIETRLKELLAGPTYVEALTLIGWIKQIEIDNEELVKDYMSIGEDFATIADEVDSLETALADERRKRRIKDLTATGNLIGELKKELSELRNIGEEFIERRDKGEIRSTYTYNRFRRALGKDDSGMIK